MMKKIILGIGFGLVLVHILFLFSVSAERPEMLYNHHWYNYIFLVPNVFIESIKATAHGDWDAIAEVSFVVTAFIAGIKAGNRDDGIFNTMWHVAKYMIGLFLCLVLIVAIIEIGKMIYNAFMDADLLNIGVLIVLFGCFFPAGKIIIILLDD